MNATALLLEQTQQLTVNWSAFAVLLSVAALPYLVVRTYAALPEGRGRVLTMAGLGLFNVVVGCAILWFSVSPRAYAIWSIVGYVATAILVAIGLVVYSRRARSKAERSREVPARLVDFLYSIDLQLTYLQEVHAGTSYNDAQERETFERVLTHILNSIAETMMVRPGDEPHLSILEAIGGRFKVAATLGVAPARRNVMERKLFYDRPDGGIAGLCAQEKKPVLVSDLRDDMNEQAQAWKRLTRQEEKPGSILAIPILAGIESDDVAERDVVAVLNITSTMPGFLQEGHIRIAQFFAQKVEIAFSCRECHNQMQRRHEGAQ